MTFICAICEQDLPLKEMSRETLQRARTNNPGTAVKQLDPGNVICQGCEVFLDEMRGHSKPWKPPEQHSFEDEYGPLDAPTLQWLFLNF